LTLKIKRVAFIVNISVPKNQNSKHMKSELENKLKPGSILVSEPFPEEYSQLLNRSVVLIIRNSIASGSSGLILNKPTEIKVVDAVENFPPSQSIINYGGKFEQNSLYYLHTYGKKIDDAIHLKSNVYTSGNFETVTSLIDTGQIDENFIKFYAGYTEWRNEELEREIISKKWFVAQIDPRFVLFGIDPKDMWSAVLKSMGGEYALMANFPEDPNLN
jgi:putative transcriptional regulator